jgi:prepilin-type N-terminal cleavage/methylation domain-containing protein/prepilin-type processing-associated H-X9-DG protein
MDRSSSGDPLTRPGLCRGAGFSLIELLVVIAVIGVLAGLLLPALRVARGSASMARELSAARELMRAWSAYAYDHDGVLIPAYYKKLNGATLPAFDESGEAIAGVGIEAATYVWRLAPYMDYDLRGLYVDKELLAYLQTNPSYPKYLLAVYPALGINGAFVGGDTGIFAYDAYVLAHFGKFYATRLSEVKHPTRLIVFASARINGTIAADAYPGARMVEGFFRLKPPCFMQRDWKPQYDPVCQDPCATADFGNVSLRHQGRQAAVGFFDGSAATLDEGTIQDMRHWSDQADQPDWKLQPLPP